ncbi:MAG: glutaminyl-peptide cyclotransferase [Euryarchaeota archaeon]|nr:glutaminyl-peptide cyclotransferase [Euryarchaeota archaeon]
MNKKLGIGITVVVVTVVVAMFAGCVEKEATLIPSPSDVTPVYGYKIVNTYPHDRNAFTQGLVFDDGFLYEGTGIRGESTLRKVELETGKVLKLYPLPAKFFGEGVTLWEDIYRRERGIRGLVY